jgi:hypothetical protein
MQTSKTKIALWVGGIAAGAIVGALIYKNRDKISPKKESIAKFLGNFLKVGQELGKKLKTT